MSLLVRYTVAAYDDSHATIHVSTRPERSSPLAWCDAGTLEIPIEELDGFRDTVKVKNVTWVP